MRGMIGRLTTLALVATLTAGLVGCGGNSNSGGSSHSNVAVKEDAYQMDEEYQFEDFFGWMESFERKGMTGMDTLLYVFSELDATIYNADIYSFTHGVAYPATYASSDKKGFDEGSATIKLGSLNYYQWNNKGDESDFITNYDLYNIEAERMTKDQKEIFREETNRKDSKKATNINNALVVGYEIEGDVDGVHYGPYKNFALFTNFYVDEEFQVIQYDQQADSNHFELNLADDMNFEKYLTLWKDEVSDYESKVEHPENYDLKTKMNKLIENYNSNYQQMSFEELDRIIEKQFGGYYERQSYKLSGEQKADNYLKEYAANL